MFSVAFACFFFFRISEFGPPVFEMTLSLAGEGEVRYA